MKQKFSPQTKSFVVLFLLAIVGTFVCLWILGRMDIGPYKEFGNYNIIQYNQPQKAYAAPPDNALAMTQDITSWKTFTSKEYGFSFKYNPNWKISAPSQKGDYTVFSIDPGKKYYNINVYVSAKDYYSMASLPIETEEINGYQAQNVSKLLYGFKNGDYYYTFDIGLSLSLRPDFWAMVHSVQFQ